MNENREVHLKVFNENTSKIRDVTIVPSKNWPGEGLLGVVLKLEKYDPHTKKTASTEVCACNAQPILLLISKLGL